jgi:hypothetical protein
MTWLTEILRGLRSLGGEACLTPDLYGWVQTNVKRQFPPNWKELIRATLQAHCATSAQFKPGNADLFQNTARGWWAIRPLIETKSVRMSKDDLRVLAIQQMTEAELRDLRGADIDVLAAIDRKALTIKERLLRGVDSEG